MKIEFRPSIYELLCNIVLIAVCALYLLFILSFVSYADDGFFNRDRVQFLSLCVWEIFAIGSAIVIISYYALIYIIDENGLKIPHGRKIAFSNMKEITIEKNYWGIEFLKVVTDIKHPVSTVHDCTSFSGIPIATEEEEDLTIYVSGLDLHGVPDDDNFCGFRTPEKLFARIEKNHGQNTS